MIYSIRITCPCCGCSRRALLSCRGLLQCARLIRDIEHETDKKITVTHAIRPLAPSKLGVLDLPVVRMTLVGWKLFPPGEELGWAYHDYFIEQESASH